jgi:hypothetical protein
VSLQIWPIGLLLAVGGLTAEVLDHPAWQNHIHRLAPPADTNGQANAAVFIKNIQEFQSAAIHCLIELKFNRPYMVLVLSSQQRSGAV